MPGAPLAAIVLNYRTAAGTIECVRSLAASTRPIDRLYVVDNGSGDGSEEELRRALPHATVLQTGSNLGFSGGCNAGIDRAIADGARLIVLVNSDIHLPPDCLGRLEDALLSDRHLGIVGPAIVTRSEPDRIESLGIAWSPLTGRVLNLGFGRSLAGHPAARHRIVDGVSGALMMIRRRVLERVGRLENEYFFSFEDLDLCLRARRAGFLTACVESATAQHEGSRSIGVRSSRRIYFATRNHLRLSRRAPARLGAPHAAMRQGVVVALNLAYVLARSPAPLGEGLLAFTRGVWDHWRRRYGASPPG